MSYSNCKNCGQQTVVRDAHEGLIHGNLKDSYAYYVCRVRNPRKELVAE